MAEFAIATGVLQVAGTGAQLGQALWKLGSDIKRANQDIGDIATEVKHISSILDNLRKLLPDDGEEIDSKATFTEEARTSLKDCLDDCESAFGELDKALRSARKTIKCGKLSLSGKWRWPLNKSSTQALQSRLRGLTSMLSLMFQVLHLARKTAENTASANDRRNIERLLQSHEELVRKLNIPPSDILPKAASPALNSTQPLRSKADVRGAFPPEIGDDRFISAAAMPNISPLAATSLTQQARVASRSLAPTNVEVLAGEAPPVPHVHGDEVLLHLQNCATAVATLASSLDTAMSAWRERRCYSLAALADSYDGVTEVIGLLSAKVNCQYVNRRRREATFAGWQAHGKETDSHITTPETRLDRLDDLERLTATLGLTLEPDSVSSQDHQQFTAELEDITTPSQTAEPQDTSSSAAEVPLQYYHASWGLVHKKLFDNTNPQHVALASTKGERDDRVSVQDYIEWFLKRGDLIALEDIGYPHWTVPLSQHLEPGDSQRVFPHTIVVSGAEADCLPHQPDNGVRTIGDVPADFTAFAWPDLGKGKNSGPGTDAGSEHGFKLSYECKLLLGRDALHIHFRHNGYDSGREFSISLAERHDAMWFEENGHAQDHAHYQAQPRTSHSKRAQRENEEFEQEIFRMWERRDSSSRSGRTSTGTVSIPQLPDESHLWEKEQIRRAEARLLPVSLQLLPKPTVPLRLGIDADGNETDSDLSISDETDSEVPASDEPMPTPISCAVVGGQASNTPSNVEQLVDELLKRWTTIVPLQ
ncbi:hypothetical protein LTR85_002085 [Meristemomyces frigidus]|nr:hypothetical protein LTR85_002085 [Meristemomyces frigidus]